MTFLKIFMVENIYGKWITATKTLKREIPYGIIILISLLKWKLKVYNEKKNKIIKIK